LTKRKIIPKKPSAKSAKADTGLNDKQLRFCEEYLVDFNATQAAIRAGYSVKTAYAIGYENLKKPAIRKFIDQKLEDLSLGKSETIKLLSDIAQSSLNDYFTIKQRMETPLVVKHLSVLIQELKLQIEDTRKFIKRAKIADPERLKGYAAEELYRFEQIALYEVELERNPKATRIVQGESRLVDVAELDLPKLVKDKQRGRIKCITPNEFGLKVELYAADAALRDIGRVHGIFEKDKEPPAQINVTPMSDQQFTEIVKLLNGTDSSKGKRVEKTA
jgi:phage terminase small subunit